MWWFETDDWPARWQCGVWPWWLAWGTICSNLVIWAAYYLIPAFMYYMIAKKPELVHHQRKLAIWFGLFVLACGTTHLFDALAYWWPAYRFNFLVRSATAFISVYSLALFWSAKGQMLKYIGPEEAKRLVAEKEEALKQFRALVQALQVQGERDKRQLREFEQDLAEMRVHAVELEHMQDRKLREMGEDIRKKIHNLRDHAPQPMSEVIAQSPLADGV